ncbi:Deleted in malignant brain tumors 1 protein, partial [Haliaeetus albicilla]
RLVNGSSFCSGRVEVFHNGEWGTVCDDNWSLEDAKVVCREVGCGQELSAPSGAAFGQGSGPIWLDEVTCAGTEAALSLCWARSWGSHNCNHGEDAGVECTVCFPPCALFSFGYNAVASNSQKYSGDPMALQLVDGPHRCAGRVEVLHQEEWGTVCDDGWDLQDAEVVCWQLGCGAAVAAPGFAHFGRGRDPIWLDEVNCTGTESALSECRAKPKGVHKCHHGEDAGAVCSGSCCSSADELLGGYQYCRSSRTGFPYAEHVGIHPPAHIQHLLSPSLGLAPQDPTDVRLVNGSNRCSGRVEVLHNQRWGSVCDDNWDLDDAEVVCQQLGCGMAVAAPPRAQFGMGHEPIWLDDVNCTGTEATLSECRARPWGESNCNHQEDASVVCQAPYSNAWARNIYVFDLHMSFIIPGLAQLRLVNGSSRCSGRVEVLRNQQWGTVCDNGWDLNDAEVVCQQMVCGVAVSAPGSAHFGPGSNHIWLGEVECTGAEVTLSECRSRMEEPINCHHGEDAGVVC